MKKDDQEETAKKRVHVHPLQNVEKEKITNKVGQVKSLIKKMTHHLVEIKVLASHLLI